MPSKQKKIKKTGRSRILLFFAFLSICVLGFIGYFAIQNNGSAKKTTQYYWVEIGPQNTEIVRYISSLDTCPTLQMDGVDISMSIRAKKTQEVSVITCELEVPKGVSIVSLNGTILPRIPTHPKKIVLLGDTGCRIKGDDAQACNDPKRWPFATVANSAAKTNPDLIIHLGDYLYRQDPCPKNVPGCKGSPYGYNWATLNADFFAPASSLLAKAPWIFIRGNHESCKRAGSLWFRFLDPRQYTDSCQDYSDPYSMHFDNVDFVNLDTADADDYSNSPKNLTIYRNWFDSLSTLSENTWLLTHRPLWAIKSVEEGDEDTDDPTERLPSDLTPFLLKMKNGKRLQERLVSLNQTLQKTITPKILSELNLVMSGHFHNFEALSFGGVVPPQLIVGNSATQLEANITSVLNGILVEKSAVTNSKFLHDFGYMILSENEDKSWTATEYSILGNPLFACQIRGRNIICN